MNKKLKWIKQYNPEDDNDNSEWEAPSVFCGDSEGGDIFMYRVRQRLREDKIDYYEASDLELMERECSPLSFSSLEKAKDHCQCLHESSLRHLEEHPEEAIDLRG